MTIVRVGPWKIAALGRILPAAPCLTTTLYNTCLTYNTVLSNLQNHFKRVRFSVGGSNVLLNYSLSNESLFTTNQTENETHIFKVTFVI